LLITRPAAKYVDLWLRADRPSPREMPLVNHLQENIILRLQSCRAGVEQMKKLMLVKQNIQIAVIPVAISKAEYQILTSKQIVDDV